MKNPHNQRQIAARRERVKRIKAMQRTGMTLEQIGDAMGNVTKQAIRNVLRKSERA